MSEKFSLKWNDFESTVSKSFSILRQEKDFFDVTLVSDDERQIPAHKLVLSACSDFFKSILRNNSHSHPLLYLSGIHSTNLSLILDYIDKVGLNPTCLGNHLIPPTHLPTHPPTLTLLCCFSAPCGQIWACEDTI